MSLENGTPKSSKKKLKEILFENGVVVFYNYVTQRQNLYKIVNFLSDMEKERPGKQIPRDTDIWNLSLPDTDHSPNVKFLSLLRQNSEI